MTWCLQRPSRVTDGTLTRNWVPLLLLDRFWPKHLLTKLAVCSCVRVHVHMAALSSAKLTEFPASFSRLMASHLAGLSGSAVIISVASVHTGTVQQHKGPVYTPLIYTCAAFGQFPQLLCLTMDLLTNIEADLNTCGFVLLPIHRWIPHAWHFLAEW